MDRSTSGEAPTLAQVIAQLFNEVENPARLLELYYWSLDPKIVKVVRSAQQLNPEVRETLRAFFAAASPKSVRASVGEDGSVVLSSPDVAHIRAQARKLEPRYRVAGKGTRAQLKTGGRAVTSASRSR